MSNKKISLDIQDQDGNTGLILIMITASQWNAEDRDSYDNLDLDASALIDKGANPLIKNKDGKSAMDFAPRAPHKQALFYGLAKFGALPLLGGGHIRYIDSDTKSPE